jgi:hypothetical protein
MDDMTSRACILYISTLLLAAACDASDPSTGPGNGDAGVGPGTADAMPSTCTGLACDQVNCAASSRPTTTLSGTVFAPNGTLPLHGVTVYVPTAAVEPFGEGVTCDRCDAPLSGAPLVQTTTDTSGHFVLENVPANVDVPLVVQVGRWRRQVVVPQVAECTDTPLDAELTRLPRNQSEGDIPLMALTTGARDALECLLRKIGIDDAEFTNASGTGRVHLYAGAGGANKFNAALGGASFTAAPAFWSNLDHLKPYDVVFLSCEGGQRPSEKPTEALKAMHDFADLGGRIFASHWHNYWIQAGPAPWPDTMTFNFQPDLDDVTADINQSFDGGAALAQWLVAVGGSTTLGKIALTATQHTLTTVNPDLADTWIHLDQTANGTPSVQYASFTTPLTVDPGERCGKVVFSDMHVASGDVSSTGIPFPEGCTSDGLSPQEKALAFMVFDLAACIGPPIE